MKNNHFYFIIALILSLLLLAGCVAEDGAIGSDEATTGDGTMEFISSDVTADQTSFVPSMTASDDIMFSDETGEMSKAATGIIELSKQKVTTSYYKSNERKLTGLIDLCQIDPIVFKVGQEDKIWLSFDPINPNHAYVSEWIISDTSILEKIKEEYTGCWVKALKPGEVTVTIKVKMDNGSYKQSITVIVEEDDGAEPEPVISIQPSPTEAERPVKEPSSEPTTTQE